MDKMVLVEMRTHIWSGRVTLPGDAVNDSVVDVTEATASVDLAGDTLKDIKAGLAKFRNALKKYGQPFIGKNVWLVPQKFTADIEDAAKIINQEVNKPETRDAVVKEAEMIANKAIKNESVRNRVLHKCNTISMKANVKVHTDFSVANLPPWLQDAVAETQQAFVKRLQDLKDKYKKLKNPEGKRAVEMQAMINELELVLQNSNTYTKELTEVVNLSEIVTNPEPGSDKSIDMEMAL